MKNDSVNLSSDLLIKSLVISFLLLAAAFSAGLMIGKNSNAPKDRTNADQGDVQEKLSECSYRLQEITAKYIKLTDTAKEKGLLDNDGRFETKLVCSVPEEKPVEKEKAEKETNEDSSQNNVVEKPKKEKSGKCLYSIQIFSDPNRDMALAAQKKYDVPDTRLVEGVVNGRNWYRIRSGCYATRSEAEIDLPLIKEVVDSALVVAE